MIHREAALTNTGERITRRPKVDVTPVARTHGRVLLLHLASL